MGEATFWSAAGGVIGGLLGGPQGALEGAALGAVVGNWLPGPAAISTKLGKDFAADRVKKAGTAVWSRVDPTKQALITKDLDEAYQDAFRDAVFDMGGAICFQDERGHKYDPDASGDDWKKYSFELGLLKYRDEVLAGEVCAALCELADPSQDWVDEGTEESFKAIIDGFVEKNQELLDRLSETGEEMYDLDRHLRQFLEVRAEIHLVEHLKQRPQAWREFNLLLLETLQILMQEDQGRAAAEREEILAAFKDLQTVWGERDDAQIIEELNGVGARLAAELAGMETRLREDAERRHAEVLEGHKRLGEKLDGIEGERPSLWVGVPGYPRYGLVGRDELLEEVIGRLTAGGAVSLSTEGMGGVGKTALAVAVAFDKEARAYFSDGVLWASVGPKGDAQLELGRWAEALGLDAAEFVEPGELKRAVKNEIGQRKTLLVIDDVWDGRTAELLRCGGPNCAHLLTTRSNEIATGFTRANDALNVPELDPDPAFELLARIAPMAAEVDEALARELARRVGGLPLAVELLGGYLAEGGEAGAELFPDLGRERLEALEDTAVLLWRAQVRLEDLSGEEQTLEEVLALSLEGLSSEERISFYALGAFAPKPAGFSREAAEAVSDADGRFLLRLVNRNLLEVESKALTLHQMLHELAHKGMDEEAQERHWSYYLALVNEDREDWRRIDDVYDQIRWAWERVEDDYCLEWVYALRAHQVKRGYWRETVSWQKRGLTRARSEGWREDEARLLNYLAWTYDDLGQRTEALRLFEEALPIVREVDDRGGEAATLNNMAMVYDATGRPAQALRLYEEALSIMREVGDRGGEAATLNNMAMVYEATGQPAEALRLFEEALPIVREVGDRGGEAATLNNMAAVYQATGRPAEALRLYEEALPIMREVGDRRGEAATLNNMAGLFWATGRPAEALRLYEEALPIMREVGNRGGEATTRWNMALLLLDLERKQEAVDCLQGAIRLFQGGLTHDSSGNTIEGYEELLQRLQSEDALAELGQAFPFPQELPGRAVAALRGDNIQKMRVAQQTANLSSKTDEAALKDFYSALQHVMFGTDVETAGRKLESPYREIWQKIVEEVEENI